MNLVDGKCLLTLSFTNCTSITEDLCMDASRSAVSNYKHVFQSDDTSGVYQSSQTDRNMSSWNFNETLDKVINF